MSRPSIIYGERRAAVSAAGQSVTEPVAGFYRYRLRSGGIRGGVRIWFGPPHDPVTGEELDRSWRWQALFDGQPVEFEEVWPDCTGEPITEAEYQQRVGRAAWARQNAPQSAYADPRRRLDALDSNNPLPF